MDDIVVTLPDSAIGSTRKRFQHLKKKYPASVVLVEEGDFFYSFDDDAKQLKELLGTSVIKSQSYFSFLLMDEYLPKLNARHSVAVVYTDEGGDPSLCTVRVFDPQVVPAFVDPYEQADAEEFEESEDSLDEEPATLDDL